MREHPFLHRLEETFARMADRLARVRRGGEEAGTVERHARLDSVRREIAAARRALAERGRADLARVRADLEDLKQDYGGPPSHSGFTRAELDAFRRHLHTTARLLGDLSNTDSPNFDRAHEEYERSWDEVSRAFEGGHEPAST